MSATSSPTPGASPLRHELVLVWHHWLALVLGTFLFLAWSALSLPATFSVVATSLDQRQHTMGVGIQSMVRRIPMMAGPLIGGWLISRYGWEQGLHFALLPLQRFLLGVRSQLDLVDDADERFQLIRLVQEDLGQLGMMALHHLGPVVAAGENDGEPGRKLAQGG